MGNDKSFYTLLNKYNTLLAQTQDLKEQLDKKEQMFLPPPILFRLSML